MWYRPTVRIFGQVACLLGLAPRAEPKRSVEPQAPNDHGMRSTIGTHRDNPVLARVRQSLHGPFPGQHSGFALSNAVADYSGSFSSRLYLTLFQAWHEDLRYWSRGLQSGKPLPDCIGFYCLGITVETLRFHSRPLGSVLQSCAESMGISKEIHELRTVGSPEDCEDLRRKLARYRWFRQLALPVLSVWAEGEPSSQVTFRD